jgi:hypothetical protein
VSTAAVQGVSPAVSTAAARARETLQYLLQLAYSGELGAARAYAGHRVALSHPAQRQALGKILRDEIHHRHCILRMMTELGVGPSRRRERKMDLVGKLISFFCFVGGWFLPMWGAGKLESQNIKEYEHAARLAQVAGLTHLVDELLEMAEVEWDHERFFREQAQRHVLWRVMPRWQFPPPREEIRASFARFVTSGTTEVEPVVAPWIVR